MTAVSRRRVLGSASLAVMAAGAALVTPGGATCATLSPDHVDAALFALCAEFWHLDALVEASNRSFDSFTKAEESNRLFGVYHGGLWSNHSDQIDLIAAAPALPIEGMRANAAVAHRVLYQNNEFSNLWDGGNEEERLALYLVRDVLRNGAGAA